MLPFQPESLAEARTRFRACLVRVWDARAVLDAIKIHGKEADRPGLHREHIFDVCANGMHVRFIVSVEHLDGETCLHASASLGEVKDADIVIRVGELLLDLIQPIDRPKEVPVFFISGVAHFKLPWPMALKEMVLHA